MRTALCLVAVTACWLIPSDLAVASDASRHALLVGVSHYPALGPQHQLQGPANDVPLMRDMLVGSFGFLPENIRILSEEAGVSDDSLLPTRANIEREFARLAEVAGSGDSIAVFMAGHGAQQPEQPNGEYREPDGLDEIFLPRDVAQWQGDGATGKVPNAIVDDEIGRWLAAIQSKNAHVWAIFDCCHSGDMTRGFGERERFIRPDDPEGLRIPNEALENARRRSLDRPADPGQALPGRRAVPTPIEMDLEGIAVLYACQPHEKAIERNLPDAAAGKPYGLLTYSLNSVLAQTGRSISYEELGKRVHQEYVQLGRAGGPTPLVEGGDVKRAILGVETLGRSPVMVSLAPDGRTLQVDAGRLHGLTDGSVLAVYPPSAEGGADEKPRPIGHVRVTGAGVAAAAVAPCEFGEIPAPRRDSLVGGRCEVVEVDYGDMQLRVAVDPEDADWKAVADPVVQTLRRHLAAIAGRQQSLVTETDRAEEAEWFVRYHAGDVYLVPASEWSAAQRVAGEEPGKAIAGRILGPFRLDDTLTDVLRRALHRIARAENLLRLASSQQGRAVQGDFSVRVKVEVRRLKDQFDPKGEPVADPARMQSGDLIQYVVSNPGNVPFDLTILYVDSSHGITSHFPYDGMINRWQPGDVKRLPIVQFTDDTLGREHVVLLAVHAKGALVDFTGLEQETIRVYRERSLPIRGGQSPLPLLLERALYGEGTTRSTRTRQIDTYQFDVIPVDLLPDEVRP